MQRTLMLISIQHELGLTIGLELRLKPMLKKFLEASLRRLSLCAGHVYLRSENWEVIPGCTNKVTNSTTKHFLSVPEKPLDLLTENTQLLREITKLDISTCAEYKVISVNGHHYHLFAIANVGVLVLERQHSALDMDVIEALVPVMERLSISCRASYEHELILLEIRKRQEAQKSLQASETRFRTVLDNIIDAIITTNEYGIIESTNPTVSTLFGYDTAELIGESIEILFGQTQHSPLSLISTLAHSTQQSLWQELEGKQKNNQTFPVELSAREMRIGDRHLFSIIIRDITERRESEDNLKTQLRFAQAITDIAELLAQEDSPAHILEGVATIVGKTLKTDRTLIYDVDFSSEHIVCLCEWLNPNSPNLSSTKATHPLRLFQGGCQHILETRHWLESQANLINPHLVDDQSGRMLHKQMRIKSLLWYPFQFRHSGYYLLAFHQVDELRQWQNHEINFLNTAVQHVNIALKKIDLLDERDAALEDLRLAATAFDAQEAMLITDKDAIIQRVNKAFTEITGFDEREVIGKTPRILKSGRHDRFFYKRMWREIEIQGYWRGELWNRRKNGEIYPQWQTITSVKNNDGEVTHYISSFQDMSERKQTEARIERLAYYDNLTDLPNRALLMDRLQHELELTRRNKKHGAVLFLDLDRFKTINDSLGHSIGDALLKQVAKRIENKVRTADTVSRLGGDEFVVVLAQLSDSAEEAGFSAQGVAEKIRVALNKPYNLHDHEYQFSPSIGIALFPENNDCVDDVLKHADAAMYQAKSQGGNGIRFYLPDMQVAADERLALEKDLRRAIANEELTLFYQPQVDHKNNIIGAEALVRWQHPKRGMVSPDNFISVAEETGQILEIGEWVMRKTIEQFKSWHEDGLCNVTPSFAINVSPRQFHQTDFVAQVSKLLEDSGITAKALKLEITENIVMADVADTIQKMEELRKLGVVFSIDDFGTGYSSLAYLKRLPLSQIKIDRSFVEDITTDPNDATIVETIISMAHHMNLDVLAEGVETPGQLSFLKQQGCYSYQGYYFSKPLPADEFEKLLIENSKDVEETT